MVNHDSKTMGVSNQILFAVGGVAVGYFLLGGLVPAVGGMDPKLIGAAAGGAGGYLLGGMVGDLADKASGTASK